MKKVIVILILIFAISLAGFLYVAKAQSDRENGVAVKGKNHYPEAVPEVILGPLPGFHL